MFLGDSDLACSDHEYRRLRWLRKKHPVLFGLSTTRKLWAAAEESVRISMAQRKIVEMISAALFQSHERAPEPPPVIN